MQAGRKVLDEVVRGLEADVEPHQVSCRRRADSADRIDRQREALVAAPAIADAEQLQAVDELRAVARLQLEREQARGALEVAQPIFVPRAVRQRRVENPPDVRLALEPPRNLERALL